MKLKKGDIFTAVLPSKEKLIEKFQHDDNFLLRKSIEKFKKEPRVYMYGYSREHAGVLYTITDGFTNTMPVYELEFAPGHSVFIRPDVLRHNTHLLCTMRSLIGDYCEVIRIVNNPVVKEDDPVTFYIGFRSPVLPVHILQDITVIKNKNDIII